MSSTAWVNGHPWDQYAWLRDNDPVHWHSRDDGDGSGFWAVTRYEDVRTVSRAPMLFSSERGGTMIADPDPMSLAAQQQMMLNMDDPRHLRFRRLVNQPFLPKNVGLLTSTIARIAVDIVDDVIETGECEFVSQICGRMPSTLVGELMGIPADEALRLYELTEIMHTTAETDEDRARGMMAVGEMLTYAGEVAARKRVEPGDDLVSALVASEVDGEHLTDAEIQWFFLLLVNAGGDTTRNLLAAAIDLLLDHPDQHQRLLADIDGLLPSAIEEFLRYSTPVVHFRRTATTDTELGGRLIREGDKVVVWYGAANRDPSVFAEPDRLDIARSPNPHLAFGGGGPHLCLGIHLARLEIDAVLREVLTRMGSIELAGPVERLHSNFIAGYHALPIRFTPGQRRSR